MCDYSLQHCKTRDAAVDDEIISGSIRIGSYPTATRGFHTAGADDVAVCLRPGTELAFDAPIAFLGPVNHQTIAYNTAIFREVDLDKPYVHHDALELPDGSTVLVHNLSSGQRARVLQLGVEPKLAMAEGRPAAPPVREFVELGAQLITVEFDDSALRARLSAMPDRVRAALYRKVSALAVQLAALVRRKLSGEVLQVRTGALRASIFEDVQRTPTSVMGRVASSGDVKYAAIHEYGGTIPAHEIVPVKAQALHWVGSSGEDVFARRVSMPDVHMPERSFLRSSLAEMKQQIIAGLTEAVAEGMR